MRLDSELRRDLEEIAARENRSLSNLIDLWLRERRAATKRAGARRERKRASSE
jgi:hypothetical protein